ncbi:PilX N-terminal domain-containing pilus assembly protein [uncultured Arenimonas sp.]|uniref:pilus assembly PilX family protein n=1 Tax=uncultured Arenimonas sp. TaxID=546226 RepID=UPI0030DC4C48
MSQHNFKAPQRQRGVTLVIVLLLLIVVTLLGLAAMRGSILQERMAGNVTARGIAFQNAESALRIAEEWLRDADPTVPSSGCSGGVCAMPVDGAAPAYEASNFWYTTGNYRAISVDDESNIAMLRYTIESLGEGTASATSSGPSECLGAEGDDAGCVGSDGAATVRNYRITAIAATDNGAEVVLQSTFQMP